MRKRFYDTPIVEIEAMACEQGFAGSMFEDPIEKPDQEW
jgi:hypothetical protein